MRTEGQTDKQADKYDEANSHFSQFCKRALKLVDFLQGIYCLSVDCAIQRDGPHRHKCVGKYSKTCLKRTPHIPETWTNGK